jgi:cbb3-type cytochrome oxidase maturation protein
MSVIYVVLPIAMVIVAMAIGAFVWSARTGQLDDLETPAERMLHDDHS